MDSATTLDYRVNTGDHDLICRTDSLSGMAESLEQLGVSRALVVCGPTILEHADVVQRVQIALGGKCVGLYAGVAPHAPVEVLEEAGAIARELRPDGVVGGGGGSCSDT